MRNTSASKSTSSVEKKTLYRQPKINVGGNLSDLTLAGPASTKKTTLFVRLDQHEFEHLKAYCDDRHTKPTTALREALRAWIAAARR
jgi:hypothetical protein